MATVKLENIIKRFGDLIALDDITLDVQDQEFFVLLGQTGAGKTTTLRCIAGLDKPEEGTIYLDGVSVNDKTPAERDVAFVFQSHILYPHLSVYENMAFPLHPRRLSADEIDRRVRDIAQMLHIEHLLMRAEIRWRQRELGTTTFYVTHDQIEAMSMADRIAVLEAGSIQQLGTPSDIYNHPANLFVAGFIGNPSMNCIPCDISSTNGQLQLTLANTTGNDNTVAIEDERIVKALNESSSESETVFGTHAEDVIVSQQPIPNAFQAEVYSVEPLGAETIVELTLGTDAAGARTILKAVTAPNFATEIGQRLQVSFVSERMHFFDKTTGNAIL